MTFRQIAELIISPDFVRAFSAGIFLLGLFIYLWLAFRTGRVKRELENALSVIRGIKDPSPAGFAREFERVSQVFRKQDSLRLAWAEFKETLVFPGPNESGGPIRNSVEPSRLFNPPSVIGSTLDMRFYSSVPNWLTGLGIFGTFLGLFAGIHLAQAGLATKDIDAIQDGLGQLLSGASLAFLTSICGLGVSILFAVAERPLLRGLNRRVATLAEALDSRVVWTTVEQIAHKQLAEAEKQTEQLSKFNTELIFSLEKALEEKVADRLSESLNTLIASVDKLATDRADTNQKVLENLTAEFKEAMTGAAGAEFEGLAETLRTLDTTLAASSKDMQARQEQLQETTQRIATNVEDALTRSTAAMQEGLGQTLESLVGKLDTASTEMAARLEQAGGEAASSLARSSEGFTQAVSRLASVAADMDSMLSGVQSTVAELAGLSESFRRAQAQMESAAVPLATAGQALAQASEASRKTMESATGLTTRLDSTVEQLESIHTQTRTAWADYEDRFRGIDESLQKAFAELDDGLATVTSGVKGFMVEVDKHLSKALEQLASAVSSLEEEIESFQEARQV